MASRMTSVRFIVSSFVIFVTILTLAPVTSAKQKAQLVPLFGITDDDSGKKLNFPRDVFIDEEHDEIYVVDTGNRRVVVFDMEGYCRYQFAAPIGVGGVNSLVVDNRGEILIVGGGKIAVCDFRGNLLECVELDGFAGAERVRPTRLCIDKIDNRYVVDANRRVLVFDSDWNFKLAIDRESFPKLAKKTLTGKTRNESMVKSLQIGDVCVDDEGMIYILDYMASYVYVFSVEGEYLRSIGEPGSSFTTLSFPKGVAVDSEGRILVVDTTSHSMLGYDKEGKLLFALGGLGRFAGGFYFPDGVSADGNGNIYVVEPFLGRVQVLNVVYKTAAEDTAQN